MKETHGLARVGKVTMGGGGDTQTVMVTDGPNGLVYLSLSTSDYPASLTPEEARFLAGQLVASAGRVEVLP